MRDHSVKILIVALACIASSVCFQVPFMKQNKLTQDPYVIKNSQKYALYSAITHCPKACIEAWTCGTIAHLPKLVNVTYLDNSVTKASGFIAYDPSNNNLVISWRGSSNTQNWI